MGARMNDDTGGGSNRELSSAHFRLKIGAVLASLISNLLIFSP